jgi:hypothetical protein
MLLLKLLCNTGPELSGIAALSFARHFQMQFNPFMVTPASMLVSNAVN